MFRFLFCLICGLGLLAGACAEARAVRRLRRYGVRVRGTVVSNEEGRGSDGRQRWVPVVAFHDQHGHRVEFAPRLQTGRKQPLGRVVKVVYLPGRAQAARLDSWRDLRVLTAALVFMGGALTIVALGPLAPWGDA